MGASRHQETFRIRCLETDEHGRATLPSLLDLFQEAAWNHARSFGLSVPELLREGITWVLFRLHVEVDRYPGWGEEVTVRTWPSAIRGLRFLRDFDIRDPSGAPIARGTTAYMVLDLATRRPTRPTGERFGFPVTEERALEDEFPRLPDPPPAGEGAEFRVRRDDLDMNRHVNTTSYARWCLESAPAELWRDAVPASLEIHYREECFLGDTVFAACVPDADDPARRLHRVTRRVAGGRDTLAAVALTRWRALSPA